MESERVVCYKPPKSQFHSATWNEAGIYLSFFIAAIALCLTIVLGVRGLFRRHNERIIFVVVSVVLYNIISGLFYLDSHLAAAKSDDPPLLAVTIEEISTTTETGTGSPSPLETTVLTHFVVASFGLCEFLQTSREFFFCCVIAWLCAECVYLIGTSNGLAHSKSPRLSIYIVPCFVYCLTVTGLWLGFRLCYRQHAYGCFQEYADYDLVTNAPNCILATSALFLYTMLLILFCLPKYLRRHQNRFWPIFINWVILLAVAAVSYARLAPFVINLLGKTYTDETKLNPALAQKYSEESARYSEEARVISSTLQMLFGLVIVLGYSALQFLGRYRSRMIQILA